MKKVTAKEAYKILTRLGLDASGDGTTYYAYDEENDAIFSFDTRKERDTFIEKVNNK